MLKPSAERIISSTEDIILNKKTDNTYIDTVLYFARLTIVQLYKQHASPEFILQLSDMHSTLQKYLYSLKHRAAPDNRPEDSLTTIQPRIITNRLTLYLLQDYSENPPESAITLTTREVELLKKINSDAIERNTFRRNYRREELRRVSPRPISNGTTIKLLSKLRE